MSGPWIYFNVMLKVWEVKQYDYNHRKVHVLAEFPTRSEAWRFIWGVRP